MFIAKGVGQDPLKMCMAFRHYHYHDGIVHNGIRHAIPYGGRAIFPHPPPPLIHISPILSLASRTQHGRQNDRKATPRLESFLHL